MFRKILWFFCVIPGTETNLKTISLFSLQFCKQFFFYSAFTTRHCGTHNTYATWHSHNSPWMAHLQSNSMLMQVELCSNFGGTPLHWGSRVPLWIQYLNLRDGTLSPLAWCTVIWSCPNNNWESGGLNKYKGMSNLSCIISVVSCFICCVDAILSEIS